MASLAIPSLHPVGLLHGAILSLPIIHINHRRMPEPNILTSQTAPPDTSTPRIVSKLLTKEYAELTCTLVRRSFHLGHTSVARLTAREVFPAGRALLHPQVAQHHGRQQAGRLQHRGGPPRHYRWRRCVPGRAARPSRSILLTLNRNLFETADPWRGDTPHSPDAPNPNRTDTILRPFKLIPSACCPWIRLQRDSR